MHTILLIEDEPAIRFSACRFFGRKGFQVVEADTCAAAVELFRTRAPDVVLLDYCLPDGDGVGLLGNLKSIDPAVPVVILTAHGSIDLAVRAVKAGAEQFFTKPVELAALLVAIERLMEGRRLRRATLATRARQTRAEGDPLVGDSAALRRLATEAHQVLGSSSPVLILGETGTGKSTLASWLHRHGPRAEEAFVDLNCAGLSRELLDSELFGYERGAFTGAVTSKPGLIEIAHRGTLFLDEIGDMDVQVQAKLLKVIEEQRFRRLGAVRDRQVSVRIVAATHRDLAGLVEEGRFRSDLYYRINTLPLYVPPLRERKQDVLPLARRLLAHVGNELGRPAAGLSPAAEAALVAHCWPGNVRELRNVLERALLRASHDRIEGADISTDPPRDTGAGARCGLTSLVEAERLHIEVALGAAGGNVIAAAATLGVSRSALYDKMKKHGIVAKPR